MGTVHVDAVVRNPAKPGREWRAPFPVGADAALESAGAEVDLRNRGLTKRPSVRLKGCVPGGHSRFRPRGGSIRADRSPCGAG